MEIYSFYLNLPQLDHYLTMLVTNLTIQIYTNNVAVSSITSINETIDRTCSNITTSIPTWQYENNACFDLLLT